MPYLLCDVGIADTNSLLDYSTHAHKQQEIEFKMENTVRSDTDITILDFRNYSC